ncbi:MAG: ABC transporter ATP-binding protein [Clostridia bacterium]|nr:ABC transporter ATP-binding protein [Clostridia bacterium]
MFGPPPPPKSSDNIEKPSSIKGYPKYLAKIIKSFFFRYFYIFKLVWEASPIILFVMSFTALFNGIFPVIGAKITAELLTAVGDALLNRGNLADMLVVNNSFSNVLTNVGILFTQTSIGKFILFELIYLVIKSIITNAYNAFINISGEKVANHIKLKIINKSKTIDMAQFDLPQFYEKLENASREASFRPVQIISSSFTMISNIISMITFIIVLFSLNPIAPLVIIVISLPAAIIRFVYGRKNFLYMRRRSRERRQMEYFSAIMTNKDLAKEIRVFNLADTFIGKFKATFNKYFKGLKSLVIKENVWHIVISIGTALVNAILFLYIGYKAINDQSFQIGDYSYYSSSLNSIISCVSTIVASTATVYQGTLFIDNIIEFNKIEPTIVPIQTPTLPVKKGVAHSIEFKNVSFSYPGSDRLVINDVSFKLDKGSTTVLVGLNGAGKTTLIKLLMRLYDPISGVILLDGEDIRKYDLKELYDLYGTIFQDFAKYAVTIEENIYFGDVNKPVSEEDILNASRQSGTADFVEALPLGYKTPLTKLFDDNGTEFSIGQWQKLSIARAFYSNSDIMILDEPTASLDALAEQQIFNQFAQLTKGKTSIFVSHRLSSATVADKIIVLEKGKIVETGNHQELMHLGKKYYELFTTQANRYINNQGDSSDS